jgi:hypothetical protein
VVDAVRGLPPDPLTWWEDPGAPGHRNLVVDFEAELLAWTAGRCDELRGRPADFGRPGLVTITMTTESLPERWRWSATRTGWERATFLVNDRYDNRIRCGSPSPARSSKPAHPGVLSQGVGVS